MDTTTCNIIWLLKWGGGGGTFIPGKLNDKYANTRYKNSFAKIKISLKRLR